MKALCISLMLFGAFASAKPVKHPKPAVHWECEAVGYGGGSGSGNHVEWASGRTKDEAYNKASRQCSMSTGWGCNVTCQPQYDQQQPIFGFGN